MNEITKLNNIFQELSTTHFCDAGATRILSRTIKPISDSPHLFGEAFIVSSMGDLIPIIRAIETAPKECVLLVSTNESPNAVAGEIFATAAKKKGIKGIIIDGFCRDVSGIRKTKIPFYAKGSYPQAGSKECEGTLNTPSLIGGQLLKPGDYIFADEDGILALDKNELFHLLPIAQEILKKEAAALDILKMEDKSLKDVLNYIEHLDGIRNNKGTTLAWTID